MNSFGLHTKKCIRGPAGKMKGTIKKWKGIREYNKGVYVCMDMTKYIVYSYKRKARLYNSYLLL